MRRLPRPYKRVSISVREAEKPREWKHVPAERVDVGDIVADRGLVEALGQGVEGSILVRFQSGLMVPYSEGQVVFAFTRS